MKFIIPVFALGYVSFCAMVYFMPQLFFYNPSSEEANLENAHKNSYPAQKVEYQSEDGTPLYAWYTPPQSDKPIIVFMHGNSYNIEKFYHKMLPFYKSGYGTMLLEYRGFGGVKGTITQQGLEQDALAAIKWLNALGYQNDNIILYGMSLGSHTASYVAAQSNFKGLILEVPFDSLYNVVQDRVWMPLPLKYIVKDKYDNISLIKKVNAPVLIMGASNDKVVPINRAQILFDNANYPKNIIIYPNAEHSNLYNYRNYNDIMKWLKSHEEA